jgi:lipid II:glycine glycyltransferase (peptidoglycan interpeptide bridge formation enzyme)
MLEITYRTELFFKIKFIYFADRPFDIGGCDVVRFIGCSSEEDYEGFTAFRHRTAVTSIKDDLDTIWNKMDKRCRRSIKRAQETGIEISINKHYKEFWQLNKRFQRQKGFYSSVGSMNPPFDVMRQFGTLITAEYNHQVIAGSAYLCDDTNMRAWIGASKRLEVDRETAMTIGYANRLIDWEAIKLAKSRSISVYDWGNLWSEEEALEDEGKRGINSYKLSFGCQPVKCCSYKKANSKLYRAGKQIYEHLHFGHGS